MTCSTVSSTLASGSVPVVQPVTGHSLISSIPISLGKALSARMRVPMVMGAGDGRKPVSGVHGGPVWLPLPVVADGLRRQAETVRRRSVRLLLKARSLSDANNLALERTKCPGKRTPEQFRELTA